MFIWIIYVAIVPWIVQKVFWSGRCHWFFQIFDPNSRSVPPVHTIVPLVLYQGQSFSRHLHSSKWEGHVTKPPLPWRQYGEWIYLAIHPPSNILRGEYPNRPKGHKVLDLILIGQEMKMFRHGMEPVEVLLFDMRICQKKFCTLLSNNPTSNSSFNRNSMTS